MFCSLKTGVLITIAYIADLVCVAALKLAVLITIAYIADVVYICSLKAGGVDCHCLYR
jgi:hypothetical protein